MRLNWLCAPCQGGLKYLRSSPTSSRRRRKRDPVPGGYYWATLSQGTYIQRPDPPGWGLDSRLTYLFCKIIIVAKSKVETGEPDSRQSKNLKKGCIFINVDELVIYKPLWDVAMCVQGRVSGTEI